MNRQGEEGATALMKAAGEGHSAIVEQLVAAGADLNRQDQYGRTALEIAEENNYAEIVDLLEVAGATR